MHFLSFILSTKVHQQIINMDYGGKKYIYLQQFKFTTVLFIYQKMQESKIQ